LFSALENNGAEKALVTFKIAIAIKREFAFSLFSKFPGAQQTHPIIIQGWVFLLSFNSNPEVFFSATFSFTVGA